MAEEFFQVTTTTERREEADSIARNSVESRLAACAQIAVINSTYRWQGNVENADEFILTMKTTRRRYEELATLISELHSYAVPEIVAVPIVTGDHAYLAWITAETAATPE